MELPEKGTPLAIGGQGFNETPPPATPRMHHFDTLEQLVDFAGAQT